MEIEPPDDRPRRTAHELVRDSLRRAILRGALGPGTRLVQADLATRLQVSTTPVREALRDLATEGLIQLDAHRGAIVRGLDPREVREIYGLRTLLEPEAMRQAARNITRADIERAKAIQARMDAESDPGAWTELNREFHGVLIDAAESGRMVAILRNLQDSAAPVVALSLRNRQAHLETANRDHHGLLEALASGDGETAARLIVEHLESTVRALGFDDELVESENPNA